MLVAGGVGALLLMILLVLLTLFPPKSAHRWRRFTRPLRRRLRPRHYRGW